MLSKETSVFLLVLFVYMVYSECPAGCLSCSGSTCTSCESSYFLTNGFCSPCPENCESCNSFDNCTSCKPKKFGLHVRCKHNCYGICLNSECYDDTGYCYQCQPGSYGLLCFLNCSLCENKLCDLRTCLSGCSAGYYEYKSRIETICQSCPTNCKHCTDGKTCYICNNGFHLYKFNDNIHCVSCLQERQCPDCVIQGCNQCQIHNDSLICADCPEGQIFNGKTCVSNTSLCSQKCSTYCDSSGICQGECNEGWTGEKCSKQCNSKCFKCSKDNGNSCLLCKGNFYSIDCSLACNPSCIVKSGHHTCEHAEGYCVNGCNQTYWGDLCDKPCPDGCKDLKCDRNNGTCTDGCKDGFTGDGCSKKTTIAKQGECNDDWTGEKCISTCLDSCEMPSKENETSFTITTSAKIVTQQQAFVQRDDKASIFTIGYFSGFGSCAAIVVFAVLFKLIRRRFIAGNTSQDNKPNVEIPTYYNTRTDFRAVIAESAEVTNNYESLGNNRTTDNVYNDLGTTLS